ncbi:MAG: putative toxin-antitoxin system toxin component, PIN family, partial [bacterium]|nr:putative toxin-antitoxin system toxin component, PIN family [bacterium]
KRFTLLISHDILTEYEEIIGNKTTPQIATNIVEMLLSLSNVKKTDIFFKWHLIEADPDDNKFIDCAIAGNADFLVTNDRHFDILAQIDFPKIPRLTIDEFVVLLSKTTGILE